MTIIEKLEKKIELTERELSDIVHGRCSSISKLLEDPPVRRVDGYELASTYFKTKSGKWYQLNWWRALIKTRDGKFLEQPFEVKHGVMPLIQRDTGTPVLQLDVWTPVE